MLMLAKWLFIDDALMFGGYCSDCLDVPRTKLTCCQKCEGSVLRERGVSVFDTLVAISFCIVRARAEAASILPDFDSLFFCRSSSFI